MANWTKDEDKKIIQWHKDGLSRSEMAALLGGKKTRNAVIGRLCRLGLKADSKLTTKNFHQKKNKQRPKPMREPRTAPPRPARPVFDVLAMPPDRIIRPKGSKRITVQNAEPHHCRMVHGDPIHDPDTWTFCGLDAVAGGLVPYCKGHYQVVYEPRPLRYRRDPVSAERERSRDRTASELKLLESEIVD